MSDHFESTCKVDGELITANCRGGTKLNLEIYPNPCNEYVYINKE